MTSAERMPAFSDNTLPMIVRLSRTVESSSSRRCRIGGAPSRPFAHLSAGCNRDRRIWKMLNRLSMILGSRDAGSSVPARLLLISRIALSLASGLTSRPPKRPAPDTSPVIVAESLLANVHLPGIHAPPGPGRSGMVDVDHPPAAVAHGRDRENGRPCRRSESHRCGSA